MLVTQDTLYSEEMGTGEGVERLRVGGKDREGEGEVGGGGGETYRERDRDKD